MVSKRKLRDEALSERNAGSIGKSNKKPASSGKRDGNSEEEDPVSSGPEEGLDVVRKLEWVEAEDSEDDDVDYLPDAEAVKESRNGEVEEGSAELDEGSAELDEGSAELDEGSAELEEGEYSGSEEDEEEGLASGSGSDSDRDDKDATGEEKAVGGFQSAYSRAFSKIMKKSVPDSSLADSLGPVLAENKKLVAKKLEEATKQTTNPELSKERKEKRELGHVRPLSYTNKHEKALSKLATKGVVMLFNAISTAQKIQTGVPTDSWKVAKAVTKQSKSAFLAELKGVASANADKSSKSWATEPQPDSDSDDAKEAAPGWSILKDNFLRSKAKLKDWDKNVDTLPAEDLRTFDDHSEDDD